MADPADVLIRRVTALTDVAARIPGGLPGLTASRDADLLELVTATQEVVLSAQGILAAVGGEISRRSSGSGEASLARRHGYRSARGLLAGRAGITFGEASRTVDVGEAIRPRVALSGEDLPAERSHVAAAVLAGLLPLSVAQLIDQTLELIAPRLLLDQEAALESALVAKFLSGVFTLSQYTKYCHEVVEQFDVNRTKERDQDLRRRSFVRESWLESGMLRIEAELDPETAAFYRAALNARTNPKRAGAGGVGGAGEGSSDGDDQTRERSNVTLLGSKRDASKRSRMEAKVAAFVAIMRDSLKRDDGAQAGVDTTILVRIDLDALRSGIGSATIDGISQPIPASAVRRLAADADLIPQVLNGKSQVLDQGESRRLFSKAQRYAILANYSGCAFHGCGIPSSMVEFHHIGHWATRHQHAKGTDLDNGIPLCGFHNRLMETGWDIRFDDDHTPWFIPPMTVDVFQRPLRGGNLTHDAA